MASLTTIRFADRGQDFLEWDIDADGTVVGCRPFQASTWCGCVVQNLADLKRGAIVRFVSPRIDQTERTIRYPLVSIRSHA